MFQSPVLNTCCKSFPNASQKGIQSWRGDCASFLRALDFITSEFQLGRQGNTDSVSLTLCKKEVIFYPTRNPHKRRFFWWPVKPCLNDPTFHPTLTQHWCWVKCWLVWTPCWITQHWNFRCWVKFPSGQKCWMTAAKNSIVFKCWMKCWVVWAPKPTLLVLRMCSPIFTKVACNLLSKISGSVNRKSHCNE